LKFRIISVSTWTGRGAGGNAAKTLHSANGRKNQKKTKGSGKGRKAEPTIDSQERKKAIPASKGKNREIRARKRGVLL